VQISETGFKSMLKDFVLNCLATAKRN